MNVPELFVNDMNSWTTHTGDLLIVLKVGTKQLHRKILLIIIKIIMIFTMF